MHPFEESNLGKAPFEYLGVDETWKSSSFCDHCWTQIKEIHKIKSSDGKNSIVGSSCIKKINNCFDYPNQTRFKNAQKKIRQQKTKAKLDELNKIVMPKFKAGYFKNFPHPFEYGKKQGKTYHDFLEFNFFIGNKTRKMELLREAEKIIKNNDLT